MPEIPVTEWARNNKIPARTAQKWAKDRRIPARKKKMAIQIVRIWNCYVVDDKTSIPAHRNAK